MTAAALPPQQQDLLDWLAAEARAGKPCPTNAAIGERFGIHGNSIGTRMLEYLEDAGHIFIEKLARGRIVTIARTGDVTARPPGSPPPRDEFVQTIGRPALGAGEKRQPYSDGSTGAGVQLLLRPEPRRVSLPPSTPAPLLRAVSVTPATARPSAPNILTPPEPEPATSEAIATPTAAPLPVTMPAGPALNADVTFRDGGLKLTVYLSTDPGPVREFKPFIIVPLTDIGALELVGTASIALRDCHAARSPA